jgi:hypothetical protein
MCVLATGVAAQARIVPAFGPPQWGWATVLDGSSSYTLPSAWHGNSAGGTVSVQHVGTGRYQVTFANIGHNAGNAQVSALGNSRTVCMLFGFVTSGPSNLAVTVRCYAPSGSLADSAFSVSYLFAASDTGPLAYLYASGLSSETPEAQYLFTSSAGGAHVQRQSLGRYKVTLFGMDTSGGHVMVSAFQGSNTDVRCDVMTWFAQAADEVVSLDCVDRHGHRIDNPFLLAFVKNEGFQGFATGQTAYLWANRPSVHTYSPASTYRYSSAAQAVTVTRTARGRYSVALTGMPATGAVQVSTYGIAHNVCHPTSVTRRAPAPLQIGVRCDSATGAAIDSEFVLLFEY